MNHKPENEYPDCSTCGMHKIKVGGVLVCPDCNTKSEPSGIVSRVADPGTKGFKKKIIKGTDGKEYETFVVDETAPDEPVQEPQQTHNWPASNSQLVMLDEPHDPVLELKRKYERYPVSTKAEFNALQKVRREIEKLEFLINQLSPIQK